MCPFNLPALKREINDVSYIPLLVGRKAIVHAATVQVKPLAPCWIMFELQLVTANELFHAVYQSMAPRNSGRPESSHVADFQVS